MTQSRGHSGVATTLVSLQRLSHRIKDGIFRRAFTTPDGGVRETLVKRVCETGEVSYSQCGEDKIVAYIFDVMLKIDKPLYLDIGAHHPTYLSNTYLFYKRGLSGICVEPDPTLFVGIKEHRKRDTCLNVGVGVCQEDAADYYVMSQTYLNTFSKEEAEHAVAEGNHTITDVIKLPLVSVNAILDKYCDNVPDYVSLDVEGLDLAILQSFDFHRYQPKVFCIETMSYSAGRSGTKNTQIIHFMEKNNYMIYADTNLNTIFVNRDVWAED